MEIFIDTANLAQIKEACYQVLDGVTTKSNANGEKKELPKNNVLACRHLQPG
jgi:hypothetical protein